MQSKWTQKPMGFTIVELLIVVVVIGILAAIVIVAYSGIQNSAYDTSVSSDINNLSKKLEIYRAQNGVYPTVAQVYDGDLNYSANTAAMPITTPETHNQRNLGVCLVTGTSDDRYIVFALSQSGNWFTRTSTGQFKQQTGTWTGSHNGSCQLGGITPGETGVQYIWGSDNVTNGWKTWVKS